MPHYRIFKGEPADLKSVSGIVKELFSFRSRAIIQLGFILLIATPVARVALSILGFTHKKDWTYVIITATVLVILLFSLSGMS
jgi:uncharacterized membrane protein